jgi:hypothetical protein
MHYIPSFFLFLFVNLYGIFILMADNSDRSKGLVGPYVKGILSTSCVIFSYPKLLSISVLTFIK